VNQVKLMIVIDVQKAFFDLLSISKNRVLDTINLAIDYARRQNIEVVYTKHIYNKARLPKTILKRFEKIYGKGSDFLSNESDFSKIVANKLENESTFEKFTYSAFFNKDLVKKVISGDFSSIIVCGLCLDICVEAFIRDAYQHNIDTVLLEDATESTCYDKQNTLDFIVKFYNTKISTVENFFEQNENIN